VVAFEADATIFAIMKRNCEAFGFKDVELNAKAVWHANTTLEFLAQGSEIGRVASPAEKNSIKVPACRLRDYLDQPVDLLKIDIEGAEADVLPDCEDSLRNVRSIIVESHDFVEKPQTLPCMVAILQRAGFRLHVHSLVPAKQPLFERRNNYGMDCQVNLFGFRD
jgi:FkbM family methyltransferase